MTKPHPLLAILMFLYALLAVVALWRTLSTQAFDLLTLGVFPVLYGLIMRRFWAGVVLKIYLAIQTVALLALATAAIIAYQITPEDVVVIVRGQNIPISAIVVTALIVMTFQFWVAFSNKTRHYLKPQPIA
ncbi:hypothetical protein L2719_05110 [Shewanella schlegeliana]|uniref:Uncharacterized protein n=1 Tax=Shewanella schlegeliana TaxID=190308 RepID=A0ABS1SWQ2_9GAMM|nr:hypothetical protein [Shewanella schlegeliana]MBL4912978.1 hypothetical protein [Shewanella schlegeliana]MCL1108926.1 hypothetical protein [Shewanella schlegeliana]GIU23663.1 hypothetical protein TUM4433_06490 [Shewanella schlegeliana]